MREWARAQRTLHGLEVTNKSAFNENSTTYEGPEIADSARRRAEMSRYGWIIMSFQICKYVGISHPDDKCLWVFICWYIF